MGNGKDTLNERTIWELTSTISGVFQRQHDNTMCRGGPQTRVSSVHGSRAACINKRINERPLCEALEVNDVRTPTAEH